MDYLHEIGIQRWRIRRTVVENDDTQLSSPIEHIEKKVPQSDEPPEVIQSTTSESRDVSSTELAIPIEEPKPLSWKDLVDKLESGVCPCCKASTPILGEGNLDADWVFVIDAPSQRDVSAQQLLSGRVGQLFDAILLSLNLQRKDVYLMSVFKCPPAEDITISAQCGDLVFAQLELLEAENIVMLGEFVAQKMLKRNESLPALRREGVIQREAKRIIACHHLQELLTRPDLKAEFWKDLSALMSPPMAAN